MPRGVRPDASASAGAISKPAPPEEVQVQVSVRAGLAARDGDLVRDHERRIEADAELADQAAAVLGLVELADEGAGAGAGDGAEVVDQLLPVHADAVVGDGQRAGRLVAADADRQHRVLGDEFGLGDRLVTELVAGVGRVRDQLAQEDVALGVDRVHHHVEQVGDFGLEGVGLGAVRRIVHGNTRFDV